MHLSSVVLPQPDGPTTQTNSPSATENETSPIACVAFSPDAVGLAEVPDLEHRRRRYCGVAARQPRCQASTRRSTRRKSEVEEVAEHADQHDRGPHRRELERVLRDQQDVADAVRAREVLGQHHDDHGEREARPHAREDLRERRRAARSGGSARAPGCRTTARCRSASGSMPRTPSIVFSRTGKRQKNAMNETFCRLPIECSRTIEIGSSAGGGIARQYSMCGIASMRAQRERPSGIPSATPTTTAIPKPSRIRSRLGTTCVSNCEKSHRSLELDEDRRQARELRIVRVQPSRAARRRGSRSARRSRPRS